MSQYGTLYMVATPIGNLEDMTFRAVRVLKEAGLIAAEDTRGSIRLLNHFEIKTPMTSYHEYNKYDKAKFLVGKLLDGQDVACITDAGTPGISDPGEELVRMALSSGIRVVPVPGACAAVNALITSGQPTRRFCFEAFLPSDRKERAAILEELREETRTIVLYEAPHRLIRTLRELFDALGDRSVSLCRELTKKHETITKTTISAALEHFGAQAEGAPDEDISCLPDSGDLPDSGNLPDSGDLPKGSAGTAAEPRGEYVLVIAGRDRRELIEEKQAQARDSMTLPEHMQYYQDRGMDRKEAMKAVAKDRGMSKREVYSLLVTEK